MFTILASSLSDEKYKKEKSDFLKTFDSNDVLRIKNLSVSPVFFGETHLECLEEKTERIGVSCIESCIRRAEEFAEARGARAVMSIDQKEAKAEAAKDAKAAKTAKAEAEAEEAKIEAEETKAKEEAEAKAKESKAKAKEAKEAEAKETEAKAKAKKKGAKS